MKNKLILSLTFFVFTACSQNGNNPQSSANPHPQFKEEEIKGPNAISFGVYGTKPMYTIGALRNAEIVKKLYPEWSAVFYVDSNTVPKEIIQGLLDRGAIVRVSPDYGNPFARFLIADEKNVQRFLVRDADSRPDLREREAVYDWIKSGKALHGMRDHPGHDFLVMAGMWGGTKGMLGTKTMAELIKNFKADKTTFLEDQNFLRDAVYPLVGDANSLFHDSAYCKKYPSSVPFPTKKRVPEEFIGRPLNEKDLPVVPAYDARAIESPGCISGTK